MSELGVDRRTIRLLVIDPDEARRASLAGVLAQEGYGSVLGSPDLEGAVSASGDEPPDLVLLDLDAPEVTAESIDALGAAFGSSEPLPVVGFISDGSAEGRHRAARIGVCDFAVRPVGVEELRLRVESELSSSRLRRLLADRHPHLLSDPAVLGSDPDTIRESLSVLAAIADYHDDDGDLHAQRVGAASAAIARALDLPAGFIAMLRDAAPLHDIGKVGISRRILLKPDKLTPPEWLHMMSHVDVGSRVLATARSPLFVLAAEIARTHHERWDGTGYTAGLRGDEIPISGRIVAVADVWDTLTHERPYRAAWEPDQALAEIHNNSGTHFDPRVVAAFATLSATDLALPDGFPQRSAA